VLDKADNSAFQSTLNSPIVSYRIVSVDARLSHWTYWSAFTSSVITVPQGLKCVIVVRLVEPQPLVMKFVQVSSADGGQRSWVMVADRCNDRVVLLDSSLTLRRVMVSSLQQPWRMSYSSQTGRLLIGEFTGRFHAYDVLPLWPNVFDTDNADGAISLV